MMSANEGFDVVGNASRKVSGRRNVQTRTQRSRDAVPAPVDINEGMEAKFSQVLQLRMTSSKIRLLHCMSMH
jgi:hypothetical protein